jgi:three-Cys-motif partner protein
LTAHEDFFTRKQAAAVLKHGIVSRYPTIFASMAGYGQHEVVLYDAYAGPGRYEDGSPGSPLLALQTAQRTKAFRNVRLVFSEEDMDNHTDLHSVLSAEAGDIRWEAIPGNVEGLARQVVAEAGTSPMLTFLDPFGVGMSYQVLTKTLLGRPLSARTEVLLNINVESVRRIGGRLNENGGKPGAGAEQTLKRVDNFLGDTWWREEFRDVRENGSNRTAAAAAEHVVNEFCRRVRAATGFESFQVPIRRRPGQVPLFILTLFYRHPVAPWKFNGCVSSANADWRQACLAEDLEAKLKATVASTLFDDDDAVEATFRAEQEKAWQRQEASLEDEWVDEIADNLDGLLMHFGSVDLALHVREVYGETLGLARDKHVIRAWAQLADRQVAIPRNTKTQARLERATILRP